MERIIKYCIARDCTVNTQHTVYQADATAFKRLSSLRLGECKSNSDATIEIPTDERNCMRAAYRVSHRDRISYY